MWVCGQWVVQGAVDVNIGANPSAEGGEEDEGVDDQAVKVVDIVDTFRLQVRQIFPIHVNQEAKLCYFLVGAFINEIFLFWIFLGATSF